MTSFMIHALSAGEADAGALAGCQTVADGPSLCRRCLRNAVVGDPLLLLLYDPFTVKSPYADEGPIFVHADDARRPASGPMSFASGASAGSCVRAYER